MSAFLRLFGTLSLDAGDVALTGRALHRKRLALLALLGAAPNGTLSRDKLAALLWPESNDERARHQLASAVYELRRALGDEAIVSASDNVRLNGERVRSDVHEFTAALAAGDLERAVSLYAGPFLDGFFVPDAAELERWVDAERSRLAHAYAAALEEVAQKKEASGELLSAVDYWRKLAAHDVYNSRAAARLMRALDAAGDRAGALRHARAHALLLREDLGVEPDAELTLLAERLQAAPEPRKVPVDEAPVTQPTMAAAEAVPVSEPPMRAPQHRRRVVLAAILAAAGLLAGWGALRLLGLLPGARAASATARTPIVVMMDSPHPARVYDDEVVQASGTNADVINDLLRDLPIQRVKETAGPFWHRHEEIRQLSPTLVVIHLSAFCTEECEPQRVNLRRFIEYLADTEAEFLIYSRMPPDQLAASFREMMGDLPTKYPQLAGRVRTFSLVDHGTEHWKDPATAAALKLRVKEILHLE